MKTIETLDSSPFKHLIMTIGELPASYVESMTYYEMLAWLCNYVQKTVIPAVNNNAEAVAEIQQWIETLDLQDEVDHKLDEMAASGELADIIAGYLNLRGILAYDTVASMKTADNLVDGSFAETYGFYAKGDMGCAKYKIRAVTNADTVDEMTLIALSDDSLVAELMHEDTMNVRQFGAKGDGETDDYAAINKAIEFADTILVPSGTYLLNTRIYVPSNKKIIGNGDSSVIKAGTIDHMISIVDASDIVIKDLKIDGNAAAKDTAGTLLSAIYGINVDFSQNVTIENVTFTDLGYKPQTYSESSGSMGGNMLGLNVNESYSDKSNVENCLVNNCRFIDPEGRSGFGIRMFTNWDITGTRKYYVKNNVISNCYFEGNNYNNIELAGQGCIYNTIKNCVAKNSKALVAFEADKGASYNTFEGNILDGLECTNTQNIYAFNCAGYDADDIAVGNIFTDNIIRNVTLNKDASCGGFRLDYCDRTIIDNLIIENIIPYQSSLLGYGILIDHATDSTISNCTIKGGTQSNAFYINLANCGDANIDNCYVEGFNYGIRTMGTQITGKTLRFTGCTFKNTTNNCANIASGMKNIIFTNNTFQSANTPVNVQNSGKATFVGNIFKDVLGTNHFAIDARGDASEITAAANYLDGCQIAVLDTNFNHRILNNMVVNQAGGYSKTVTYASSAPASGNWRVGDLVYNQNPTAGGNIGWVCTANGTPGTWKSFGAIEA